MNQPVDKVEANRLYWETDESVADIARRLDMSRRALYVAVEPLPTGGRCERCGGPLTYENRSARTAGHASCEACAEDEDTEVTQPPEVPPAGGEFTLDERSVRLGGAMLIGAAVGALLTFAAVPKR
jgi:transposase-like protein